MSSVTPTTQDHVAEGFRVVHDAFRSAIVDDTTSGAALSIWRDGELVVDLAGGIAQPRSAQPWTLDTPSVIFSCTKGLMSILLARLVQEGRLDYDARVSDYWPEYAVNGKESTRVSAAASHRAGLLRPAHRLDVGGHPGLEPGDHALGGRDALFGSRGFVELPRDHAWMADRRARPPDQRDDAWRVLRPGRHRAARCTCLDRTAERGAESRRTSGGRAQRLAELVSGQRAAYEAGTSIWPYRAMTLGGALPPELVGDDEGFNRADVRAAQIPGAGGVSTAHALAKIWSAVRSL